METRGIMGGFYRISEWIMRLSAINLLWLISSFPIVFLFLGLLRSPDLSTDFIKSWFLMVAIVAPFSIVPASAAMFSVARKWVTGDPDVPLWRSYWRGYKENYVQSMLGGIVFLAIAFLLVVNFYFYRGQTGIYQIVSIVFLMLMVLLVAAFLNFLCVMTHLHMKLFQIVKNSLLMTIGQPFSSISLLVLNGAIVYISFRFSFLAVFFMGSLMAAASFWNFHRSFTKIQTRYGQKLDEEAGNEIELEKMEELEAPKK
ncbi:MAG: DUF624 domain-containing protein [Gorillibacterium sp.]|nr:DUF624 domain-containing protein [Gorillibacterium sp.]